MADFVQTMKDWHRMCKAMTDRNPKDACDGCPLEAYGCSPVYEAIDSYSDVDFKVVGEKITAWAAEHPEPVYPTWGQYFRRYYGLEYCKGHEMLLENIPADIAEKLGIEPKEGV